MEWRSVLNLEVSDLVLLAIGVYFALTSLVRLMRNRRDELVQQLTAEAEEQERQKQADEAQKNNKADSGQRKAA
jgi:hypothetical protein